MSTHRDVVVIGGGQAGLAIGYHLAQQGRDFTILEAARRARRGLALALGLAEAVHARALRRPARARRSPGDPDRYPTRDEVVDYLTGYAARLRAARRARQPRPRTCARPTAATAVELDDRTHRRRRRSSIATGPFQTPRLPVELAEGLDPRRAACTAATTAGRRDLRPAACWSSAAATPATRSPRSWLPTALARCISRSARARRRCRARIARPRPVQRPGGDRPDGARPSLAPGPPPEGPRDAGRLEPAAREAAGHPAARPRGLGVRITRSASPTGPSLTSTRSSGRPASSIDHSWIDAPVFDDAGQVVHERGVTASPGLYFLGLPWLHTRGSALLGWVKHDAAHIAEQIASAGVDLRRGSRRRRRHECPLTPTKDHR